MKHEYGIEIINRLPNPPKELFDVVILGVAHDAFRTLNVRNLLAHENGVICEIKGILDRNIIDGRL